jgi:hypothetical protein
MNSSSIGTGRLRPLSSKSPNRIRCSFIATGDLPPLRMTSTGATRNSNFTSSSRASSISSG